TKPVHQGYIEPHSSTAFWAPDGNITVWTSTQGAFGIRGQVAAILRVPEATVKVVPMEMGGGFGGKINTYLDPLAAILSKKTGHPVKIVMTRKEEFEGSGPTSGSYMKVKIGAKKNGTLTAAEVYLAFEAGAFPGSPVGSGASTCLSPYVVENFQVDGYDVVVNKQKTSAYRAPGSPQAGYAVEAVMDEVAQLLNMDPLEFRLKNAPKNGDRQVSGVPHANIGCIEVEEAMKAHPHYQSKLEGPYRGRGIAMGYWFNAGMMSSATLSVNSDGSVSMVTGSVDLCGTRVVLAMQVAEALGINVEDVIPSVGDTDSVGWTGISGGSRTAFSTGLAVISASENIIEQFKARAAILWEVKPEDVEFNEGNFINLKSPDEKLSLKALAAKQMATGGPITASATSNPRQVAPAFAGNIVDVEVDPETGKVEILRYTAVEDVGQAGHPSYVEGQMQGGTVQGIGWALNEEYVFNDEGVMLNPTFLDYRMPTSLDLPMIDTVMVNVPNPAHPYGLRGVGEVSIVVPMGAIANAVSRAIGTRITQLPMSPTVVLEAMQSKK
ncbi:MAG: molybdopterin-dependent oxidoreductase, partial [Chloroflexi bacterium]|nr:molybdopterin-dependent oxidoreductase [Chloroflexota bacterium]